MTMLRSTTGMLAAKPTPCCSRRSFTASMTGPSCTETVPSPPIASAASGSPCTAATKAWWLRVSAARQISANAGDSTSRSTMPETSDCSPWVAGASSNPSACSARGGRSSSLMPSKRSDGQRRDVDLLLDRRGDLVADVRLHRRLLGERRERGDELVGVDELDPCPRRDHGHGCEQQGDDDEHDGRHGAPAAAALARRRARGIRAVDRPRRDRLGPQRGVLGFERRDPGFEFRRPCIRHVRPLLHET